jgi:DNA (cytosine-5)-methyltransferase 1
VGSNAFSWLNHADSHTPDRQPTPKRRAANVAAHGGNAPLYRAKSCLDSRTSGSRTDANRVRILDLYCCQGGASKGYVDAGFDVVGVDLAPQPKYPFAFHQADALEALQDYIDHGDGSFDAIHASPPCQAYSKAQRLRANDHPDLIGPTRELLEATGLPYVIENVEDARGELRDPVMLCGTMFGLPLYRHRLFETNWPLTAPLHGQHYLKQVKMGRKAGPGEILQVVGNFTGVDQAREAMGMPWASRDGLREAIPPSYTSYIGEALMSVLTLERAA